MLFTKTLPNHFRLHDIDTQIMRIIRQQNETKHLHQKKWPLHRIDYVAANVARKTTKANSNTNHTVRKPVRKQLKPVQYQQINKMVITNCAFEMKMEPQTVRCHQNHCHRQRHRPPQPMGQPAIQAQVDRMQIASTIKSPNQRQWRFPLMLRWNKTNRHHS